MPSLPGSSKSTPPKKPTMNRLKSWSAGLGAKLSGGSSDKQEDLASEVEQRRKGIDSLYTSTEAYWSYLGKKKPVPFDTSSLPIDETASSTSGTVSSKPERKMLPVEALGLAMSSYATAFPDGSAYGSCLGLLGEAHIKLGYLQSAFTKDTSHIFLARIARSKAALDSLTAALKKLDSATARLESAQSKVQKSKKEKRELEEELRLAKAAYDDAVTDVEVRSDAIRDSEYDDWQCLTTYMQAQLDYMGQAQAVLEQVKSMWGEPPAAAGTRSGASTPLTRPRSMSTPKIRPAISRRSSAKDGADVATTSSRFGSRSSLSLTNSNEPTSSSNDETKRETEKQDKEKKSFLRMPSFAGASDTVSSVTSGIGSSIGRARSSSLFGAGSGQPSPEKDREPSKWSFMPRTNKKEAGFVSMDEAERPQFSSEQPPALPARDYVRPSVSAHDVNLGAADHANGDHGELRVTRYSSDSRSSDEDGQFEPSPFSPGANDGAFLGVHRAHETIHERGESGLSADYIDSSMPLALNHTGLSAYSDGANPFGNGGAMSPQATGGQYDANTDDEDEMERQGLTGRVEDREEVRE
uniref:BAR domain-containing protein n=1 Tax=Kalmanozyma brasiliensis (strain GHG001) TaxID=1365824 RepID=V5ESB4_KALBG